MDTLFKSLSAFLAAALLLTVCAGCKSESRSGVNPVVPGQNDYQRTVLDFQHGVHTILGELPDNPAADVDLATVVWGQISAGEGSGDIVVFDDDTSWVVAVGIVEDPTTRLFHCNLRFDSCLRTLLS